MIKPGELFPDIELTLVGGKKYRIYEHCGDRFLIMVAYRGYHSRICRKYLTCFDEKIIDFDNLGVNVIALSGDTVSDAQKTCNEWQLEHLDIAYGVSPDTAKSIGLFISKAEKGGEPDYFLEPGLFVINKDRTLYASTIQTMAFARPKVDDILSATKFVIENKYPLHGNA